LPNDPSNPTFKRVTIITYTLEDTITRNQMLSDYDTDNLDAAAEHDQEAIKMDSGQAMELCDEAGDPEVKVTITPMEEGE
jgi:hypothetical protein